LYVFIFNFFLKKIIKIVVDLKINLYFNYFKISSCKNIGRTDGEPTCDPTKTKATDPDNNEEGCM